MWRRFSNFFILIAIIPFARSISANAGNKLWLNRSPPPAVIDKPQPMVLNQQRQQQPWAVIGDDGKVDGGDNDNDNEDDDDDDDDGVGSNSGSTMPMGMMMFEKESPDYHEMEKKLAKAYMQMELMKFFKRRGIPENQQEMAMVMKTMKAKVRAFRRAFRLRRCMNIFDSTSICSNASPTPFYVWAKSAAKNIMAGLHHQKP